MRTEFEGPSLDIDDPGEKRGLALIGQLNQLIHLWKFDDDADRRRHWAQVYADPGFQQFASRIRPLIMSQENKILQAAPWGPHP